MGECGSIDNMIGEVWRMASGKFCELIGCVTLRVFVHRFLISFSRNRKLRPVNFWGTTNAKRGNGRRGSDTKKKSNNTSWSSCLGQPRTLQENKTEKNTRKEGKEHRYETESDDFQRARSQSGYETRQKKHGQGWGVGETRNSKKKKAPMW